MIGVDGKGWRCLWSLMHAVTTDLAHTHTSSHMTQWETLGEDPDAGWSVVKPKRKAKAKTAEEGEAAEAGAGGSDGGGEAGSGGGEGSP